ncbi:uncharacterized protein LOC135494339 [Lineus longissimus]|uniref:uncharacterized protein LOC135494339 n=1 Tax=Lineus longissimus TaxID=88925 RepID=UPI00315DE02C
MNYLNLYILPGPSLTHVDKNGSHQHQVVIVQEAGASYGPVVAARDLNVHVPPIRQIVPSTSHSEASGTSNSAENKDPSIDVLESDSLPDLSTGMGTQDSPRCVVSKKRRKTKNSVVNRVTSKKQRIASAKVASEKKKAAEDEPEDGKNLF